MSKSQAWAACAAAFLAVTLVVSTIVAQGPAGPSAGQPAAGQPVYLLDLSYVFKNYSKFKAMKDQMQADVQAAEARVKRDKETINKLREQLEGYHPGSEDYKKLEQDIATRIADLNVLIALQGKEFRQQEARNYFTVYQEVRAEVDYFASQNRAAMVLRFDREDGSTSADVPDTVVRVLNKSVIWNSQGLDISDYILNNLNGRIRTADGTGPRPRSGPPLRPN